MYINIGISIRQFECTVRHGAFTLPDSNSNRVSHSDDISVHSYGIHFGTIKSCTYPKSRNCAVDIFVANVGLEG